MLSEDVVFGVISSASLAYERIPLIKLWWLEGTVGCYVVEGGGLYGQLNEEQVKMLPPGLEVCTTPDYLRNKTYYEEDNRGTHRGALMPLILYHKFPDKLWYVLGDDDTMFSQLAVAQYLRNYDYNEPWYIASRCETVLKRLDNLAWDAGLGGGGLILSQGLMTKYGNALIACYDNTPWYKAKGGDWMMYQCLTKLGIPLTPASG
jgi:hypothetical protein